MDQGEIPLTIIVVSPWCKLKNSSLAETTTLANQHLLVKRTFVNQSIKLVHIEVWKLTYIERHLRYNQKDQ